MSAGRVVGLRMGIGVAAAAAVAGCGTHTVVRTVTSRQSASPPTATSAAPARSSTSDSHAQTAKVGDTLTLHGNGGESVAVTVDQVMDPLAVGTYDQPDPGQRFVGVQITLKNVGSVTYWDAPSNGATLLSNANEQAQTAIVSNGPCGSDFQSSVNIAPGDTEQGCVPFEMTNGQAPSTFQFTLNSGFANQTGQWSLAGASTQAASPTPATAPSPSSPQRGGGPLATLKRYWNNINSGRFAVAYGYLAPGAINASPSQFASQERQEGVLGASFTGHVASVTGSSATVDVDSLTTNDSSGCHTWTGSYELSNQTGHWLIERANITPSPCS